MTNIIFFFQSFSAFLRRMVNPATQNHAHLSLDQQCSSFNGIRLIAMNIKLVKSIVFMTILNCIFFIFFLYRFSPSPEPASMATRGWFRRKPVHRLAGAQRTSYDLRERICIGSMTAIETAVYQKVPTDEAEAQMLASADLDDMKSKQSQFWKRCENNRTLIFTDI